MSTPRAHYDHSELIQQLRRLAPSEGDHGTKVTGLTAHRRNKPTEPLHCIYTLSVSFIAQGGKRIFLNGKHDDIEEGQSILTTLDMPVVSHVTRATPGAPFLALQFELDASMIAQLAAQLDLGPSRKSDTYRAVSYASAPPNLIDAFGRLLRLTAEPHLIPALEPGLRTEITVRLLEGPHGPHLMHMMVAGSPGERIGKVVSWLKQNYARPLDATALAELALMSPSTFRRRFRAVTGTSPLQFQKRMRLEEARHLMLSENQPASTAAREVGYTSATQFSREYNRTFGAPPRRDIARLQASEPPY